MSSVKEIEAALERLTLNEKQMVRDWLEDLIEEQIEVSDNFKTKMLRAKAELADGAYSRVRNPSTRK